METLNLPKIVMALLDAQERFDSEAYARCFSENAKVVDEGKTHQGYAAIEQWIRKANALYKTTMEPVDYHTTNKGGVMRANVSGTFPGSPAILIFHFQLKENLIESLKITG